MNSADKRWFDEELAKHTPPRDFFNGVCWEKRWPDETVMSLVTCGLKRGREDTSNRILAGKANDKAQRERIAKLEGALRQIRRMIGGPYPLDVARSILDAALGEEKPDPIPSLEELRLAAGWSVEKVDKAMRAACSLSHVQWNHYSIKYFEAGPAGVNNLWPDRAEFLAWLFNSTAEAINEGFAEAKRRASVSSD